MAWTCSCGQENEGKFCIACGSAAPAEAPAVETPAAEPVVEPVVEAAPVVEPVIEPVVETVAEPVAAEPAVAAAPAESVEEILEPVGQVVVESEVDPDNFKPAEPDHRAQIVVPAEPVSQPQTAAVDPDDFKPAPMHPEKANNSSYSSSSSAAPAEPGKTTAIVALILAICGIFIPCIGPICAIVGLILSIVSKNKGFEGGIRTAAFIISIISIGLSLISLVVTIVAFAQNYM